MLARFVRGGNLEAVHTTLTRSFSSKIFTNRKFGEKVPPRDPDLFGWSQQERKGNYPQFQLEYKEPTVPLYIMLNLVTLMGSLRQNSLTVLKESKTSTRSIMLARRKYSSSD